MTWKYKVVKVETLDPLDIVKFQENLDDLGDDGWEFISVQEPSPGDLRYIFKKPSEEGYSARPPWRNMGDQQS